jgi:hypothetical protein
MSENLKSKPMPKNPPSLGFNLSECDRSLFIELLGCVKVLITKVDNLNERVDRLESMYVIDKFMASQPDEFDGLVPYVDSNETSESTESGEAKEEKKDKFEPSIIVDEPTAEDCLPIEQTLMGSPKKSPTFKNMLPENDIIIAMPNNFIFSPPRKSPPRTEQAKRDGRQIKSHAPDRKDGTKGSPIFEKASDEFLSTLEDFTPKLKNYGVREFTVHLLSDTSNPVETLKIDKATRKKYSNSITKWIDRNLNSAPTEGLEDKINKAKQNREFIDNILPYDPPVETSS